MQKGMNTKTLVLLALLGGGAVLGQVGGAAYGPNLIQNPGAEVGGAVTDASPRPFALTGWTSVVHPTSADDKLTGVMDAESYGDTGDMAKDVPGPKDRGLNYFSGRYADQTARATQYIDLSARTSAIDTGKLAFELSGWLGGYSDQDDNARLSVTFQNAAGATLKNATIGPVLAPARNNGNGLVYQRTAGTVPVGARRALITLTMTRTDGTYNDGYADNLSFKLGQ